MSCSIIRNKENNNIQEVLAPNGQPSVLFQSINEKIKDKEDALNRWLIAYTPTFKNTFGDWESFAKAKSLFDTNIKGLYKSVANSSPEQFLFEIAIQANSSPSERLGAENAVGKEIVIEALNLYPNVKVGDTFVNPIKIELDINGEPLLTNNIVKFINLSTSDVFYNLKSLEILSSDKAKQVFEKGKKAGWDLNKILTELQVPKEQKQLILDLGVTTREQIALELASNYSYTVEINTAKDKTDYRFKDNAELADYGGSSGYEDFEFEGSKYTQKDELDFDGENRTYFYKDNKKITKKEFNETAKKLAPKIIDRNSSYYANLTVPGGTNYTENEIATPAIIPSIKGHAQFSTDNGIGWFRSDEKSSGIINPTEEVIENEYVYPATTVIVNRKEGSKTRRILEVQSDIFQKSRDIKSPDEIINELKKSGELQIKCD